MDDSEQLGRLVQQLAERLPGVPVLEVIRAIQALGYTILRHDPVPDVRGRDASDITPTEQLAHARRHAEELLAIGEPILAYDAIGEALERWPGDHRLRQLRGLALARSGAPEHASRTMRELLAEGHDDAETLGILARTHKDLAARATSETERRAQLEQALRFYSDGWASAVRRGHAEDAYYAGINSASLSLLLGRVEHARDLARSVSTLCAGQLERFPRDPPYWLLATLAEAALLLGERAEAEAYYRRAAERTGVRHADLSVTRHQARLLLAHHGEPAGWIDRILRVPPVVVCGGHMIDRPGRATPRFPPEREGHVSRALRDRLQRLRPTAGYASAACGADILFLEAMLAQGTEFHVILPFSPAEFLRTSVDIGGGDWPRRFERVLGAAASLTVTSDDYATGSDSSFRYASLIVTGMAMLHARRLETELVPLVVWDGEANERLAGTAFLVERWRSQGLSVERIDPCPAESDRDLRLEEPGTARSPGPAATAAEQTSHRVLSMLFADSVGFSKLRENQIPLFVEHVLTPIAEVIERSPRPPILKKTAGDGLYLAFAEPRDAGVLALELQELFSNVDWEAHGLPATMGLRVALHCGPVHELIDPITGLLDYTGPHTSRAARIEPITPRNEVYASQAFAAIAAATSVSELAFEYVGRTALAKEYGSLPLYHVRRARRSLAPPASEPP